MPRERQTHPGQVVPGQVTAIEGDVRTTGGWRRAQANPRAPLDLSASLRSSATAWSRDCAASRAIRAAATTAGCSPSICAAVAAARAAAAAQIDVSPQQAGVGQRLLVYGGRPGDGERLDPYASAVGTCIDYKTVVGTVLV